MHNEVKNLKVRNEKETKTLIQKDTCTAVFIAAVFTVIGRTWMQPKCPLREECIYIQWSISHKKDEILPFATTQIDLEYIMLSKSYRENQLLYDITYMWNLKNKAN